MASSPSVRAARIGVLIATLIGGCEVNPTYIACQEDSNCPPGYFCGAWGFCGAGAAASDGGVDAGPPADAGADAGIGLGTDAGTTDAGGPDAGPPDAGPTDAGPQTGDDAGPQTGIDAGPTDAGATDAGGADAGGADAGNTDAGTRPECNSGVYPDGGTVFLADGGGVAYEVNCAAGEICALGGHCATPEYSVDGGIVTDNVTGLQWQQDVSSAPCAGSP